MVTLFVYPEYDCVGRGLEGGWKDFQRRNCRSAIFSIAVVHFSRNISLNHCERTSGGRSSAQNTWYGRLGPRNFRYFSMGNTLHEVPITTSASLALSPRSRLFASA